ncbi:MAG: hypothetical protein ACLUFV_07265 [Acutalibacteraceae bacterium]
MFKANAVLSGGERARLSIAKLILKGASLLILTNRPTIWTSPRARCSSRRWRLGGTVPAFRTTGSLFRRWPPAFWSWTVAAIPTVGALRASHDAFLKSVPAPAADG